MGVRWSAGKVRGSTLESAGAPELLLYLVIQWAQRFLVTEALL